MARQKSDTVQLKVRMKEALRSRLEASAKANKVSLNAEAVNRLEASFRREDAIIDELGGETSYKFFRAFAGVADWLTPQAGSDPEWVDNWETIFRSLTVLNQASHLSGQPDAPTEWGKFEKFFAFGDIRENDQSEELSDALQKTLFLLNSSPSVRT